MNNVMNTHEGEKMQYTTRLSTKLLSQIQQIANDTGASVNSVLAMLVSMGLKVYEGEVITKIVS